MALSQDFLAHIEQQLSEAPPAEGSTAPAPQSGDGQPEAAAPVEGKSEEQAPSTEQGETPPPSAETQPQPRAVPQERFDRMRKQASQFEHTARTLAGENQQLKERLAKLEGMVTGMRRGQAQPDLSDDDALINELLGIDSKPQGADKPLDPYAEKIARLESFAQSVEHAQADAHLEKVVLPALMQHTGFNETQVLNMLARGMDPNEIMGIFPKAASAQVAPTAASSKPAAAPPPPVPRANSSAVAPARAPSRMEWGKFVDQAIKGS